MIAAAAVLCAALAVRAQAQVLLPEDRQPIPGKPRVQAVPGQGARLRQDDGRLSRLIGATTAAQEESIPWTADRLAGVVPDPAVTALVRRLSSLEWAERADATARLLDRAIPDEQVWVHLRTGGLPAEAHARLLHVGQERLVHAPRGALGIQMAARFEENDGVVVTGLVPGMPAQKVLKPGDRIVSIEGQRIQVSTQLTAIVQARRPGDRIAMIVMRGERDELGRVKGGADGKPVETRVELQVELGSREDLDRLGDGNAINDAPAVEAQARLRALRLAEDFPVPVAVLPVQALAGERPDVDSHPDIVRLKETLANAERSGFSRGLGPILQAQLRQLEAQARVPTLEPAEREWWEAVVERFRELMPPDLREQPPAGAAPRSGTR